MRRFITWAIAICLIAMSLAGCVPAGTPDQTASPALAALPPMSIVPSPSPSAMPTPMPSPSDTPEPSLPVLNPKAQEALDYFMKVALQSEYHDTAASKGVIKRWEQPIYLEAMGKYTKKDIACIDQFMKTYGAIQGLPPLYFESKDGNDKLYFVKLNELPDVCPGYVSGNWAYTTVNWTDYSIDNAISGVAIDVTNQKQRNHLIIERIVDSLGLLNDVNLYPDSIFYDKWTETQKLSELDWLLIRMLYSPAVKAGMGAEEARKNLTKWLAEQEDIK